MEREKIAAVIPSEVEGFHDWMQLPTCVVFAREILHYVHDDGADGEVMHGVVLKWNKKNE